MSKEYYKKKIIDLRAKLQTEKDAKKKDNERYADYIKRATTTDRKAYYRKEKVSHSASHDRTRKRGTEEGEVTYGTH